MKSFESKLTELVRFWYVKERQKFPYGVTLTKTVIFFTALYKSSKSKGFCRYASAQLSLANSGKCSNKRVDAMIYSWNNHNYDALKNYTTENTDWVNVVGMWWKGRKESQYAHQVYHNTISKTAVCQKKSVVIRFLTNDVAIAHIVWHFSDPHPVPMPDGRPSRPTDGLATLVYVKQNGKWLMDAGENVVIDTAAQPFDPVKQMPKN